MKTEIKLSIISSAQIVGSIDDLLTQIILRLPMKPLIRFKSVSKHWNSLISDPGFCILRNPDPNPAVGIIFQFFPDMTDHDDPYYAYVVSFDKSSTAPPFRKLNFTKDPLCRDNAKILNSCNGLLVCGVGDIYDPLWNYYIYNPTTNKYSTLPKLDRGSWISNAICVMILAFDPSKSPHYKVVCVRGLGFWDQYQFEVYSSESRSWRNCGDRPFIANVNFKDGVYWNGAIHWISITGYGESIYFNPNDDDQIFPKVMPTPPILNFGDCMRDGYFGVSCDHLHYIDVYKRVWFESDLSNNVCKMRMDYREHEFNVYEMRRDYSEWFVRYKVDITDVVNAIAHSFISICGLVRGKNDEDSFLVLVIEKSIVRYNLVFETYGTICDFDGVGDCLAYPGELVPLQYIESLCCV